MSKDVIIPQELAVKLLSIYAHLADSELISHNKNTVDLLGLESLNRTDNRFNNDVKFARVLCNIISQQMPKDFIKKNNLERFIR